MRRCRREWLLALCLVSVQLLAPTDCERLLIGARASSPPALTPPLIKQVDDLVEHAWLKCGLDKRSLEDVRKHFDYNHVFEILRRISGRDIKDTSPDIEDGTNALSPEIRHTLLNCLSKQSFPLDVSGQEGVKNLPAGYIKTLIASIRRDLAQGPSATSPTPAPAPTSPTPAPAPTSPTPAPAPTVSSPSPAPATQAVKPVLGKTSKPKPAKEPIESVSSPPDPPDRSSEKTPIEKAVPPTKSLAKKDSNGMPTTAVIGLSVAGIALLALLCLCCCMCRGNRTSSSYDLKDDKPLLSLNLSDLSAVSHKSSQGNPIDVNKLGALSLKSESGQNDHVKLSSHDGANTEVHPAVYNSPAEPVATSISSVQGSAPMPPPVMPPPAPPPPKAPPPPAPQAPAPPPKASPVPPSGPSPPPAPKAAPPPPPPKSAGAPRPPPPALPGSSKTRPQPPLKKTGNKADTDRDSNEAKTKLKPFFWDKVTANPDHSMVWDHIKSGSFQFNEEMIESLFGYNSTDKKSGDAKKDLSSKDASQFVRILDPKKAQNLAISLKALSVSPEEVCSAVKEGSELPSELIQTLLRWTPSNDEELRLRLYTGELSQLGPAEQFLRAIIDIPYVFQRLDALLFMASLPEEASNVKQSFATLEVACQELRNSRLFLKLLEAVLKTGNRMNVGTFRGGAQAFKLDTLLKLSDVKGTDGKTTLLHFVVQEIIRSEGVRAARAAKEQNSRVSSVNTNDLTDDNNEQTEDDYKQLGLKVVSSLGDELQNVRKAAILDADQLTMLVASLGHKLVKTNEFLNTSMNSLDEDSGFHQKLKHFVEQSQPDITFLLDEEKKIRSLVRSTVDYFHGSAGKDEGLRLFVIVRDFLAMLDKVCKEVKEASKVAPRKTKTSQPSQSSQSFRDPRRNLFPAIQDRRPDSSSSSSDEES